MLSSTTATGDAWVQLERLPRVGWMTAPSPLEALARPRGPMFVKRDDRILGLCGGSKVRKLDMLLASEPYKSAAGWHGIGSMGSGQLVALSLAAAELEKTVDAHCFWAPTSEPVVQNLAAIASSPHTRLHYHATRLRLFGAEPRLFTARALRGSPVVPPGATCPLGMFGFVLAGLELATQLRELGTAPDRVYLPFGSGGSAVGLAVGLRLAGLDIPVVAITVIETAFSSPWRIRALRQAVTHSLGIDANVTTELIVDRRFVGASYGALTRASLEACVEGQALGLTLDPAYGGKAMAALLADVQSAKCARPLFWHTGRGPLPPPAADWRERVPRPLQAALDGGGPRFGRRTFLAGGAVAAGAIAAVRLARYERVEGWDGLVLNEQEARTIIAAAEALFGRADKALAETVDRYLAALPPAAMREIHALLAMVEHASPLGARSVSRFSALTPDDRLRALARLGSLGGLMFFAARGVRDLCLLGHYAQSSAWPALHYEGPWVKPGALPRSPHERLRAPAGSEPPGARYDL